LGPVVGGGFPAGDLPPEEARVLYAVQQPLLAQSPACRAPATLLIAVSSDRFGRLDGRMSSRGISGSFEINRDWIAGRKGLLESFVEQLVEMLGSRLSVQWRIFAV
jgi:hypothetical protein